MSIIAISDNENRSGHERPRISVVTAVWNGEKTLARTIDSVRAQKLPGLEYVIIDAGSRDRTLDIIRDNADIVTFWKSEPDRGISDGFNKGIALSHGAYVTILSADDWLSPGQLAAGLETLEKTGADFVFGDLIYHDVFGRPLHMVRGDASYSERIAHVMPALNHPTVIVRRDAYERFGLFDPNLQLAMDYELLLRFHRAGCRGVYDPLLVGHMTLNGASDRNSRRALAEVRSASIAHGYPATKAWPLYWFRIVKGILRRMSEKYLPHGWHERLRGRFNRNYAGPS